MVISNLWYNRVQLEWFYVARLFAKNRISTTMTYPAKDKFQYNLSKRIYEYYNKDTPPLQEIDKEHPAYKYGKLFFTYIFIGTLL